MASDTAGNSSDVESVRKAAEKGNAVALHNLGVMYAAGEGVPKDAAMAAELWRKAGEKGLAEAQVNLGISYAAGVGVPKDTAKAVEWWRKAAEQGNAMSQFMLGDAYMHGIGVARDLVRAHMWLNLAATSGLDGVADIRQKAESEMTKEQVAEAERLARDWYEAHQGEKP